MRWTQVHAQNYIPNSTQGNKLHWLQQLDMRECLSAHIETNNTDYRHASTNRVQLPGLEGLEIDSRLPGPDTLRRPLTLTLLNLPFIAINNLAFYCAVLPVHSIQQDTYFCLSMWDKTDACKSLIRPVVEYVSLMWSPHIHRIHRH